MMGNMGLKFRAWWYQLTLRFTQTPTSIPTPEGEALTPTPGIPPIVELTMPPETTGVSMVTPLQLPVSRKLLIGMLEAPISNIIANQRFDDDLLDREELELMTAQRRQFIEWLRKQPEPCITMAMYPVAGADTSHWIAPLVSTPQIHS